MKRFVLMLTVLAALVANASAGPVLKVYDVSKGYFIGSAINVDSSYANTGAGFQIKARTTTSADTTTAIDISRMLQGGFGQYGAATTLQGFCKLWIVPGIGTMDSLNVDWQVSPDGVYWSAHKGLQTWTTAMTAGKAYAFPITIDSDIATADAYGARYIRFFIHGRTGGAYNACRAFLTGWEEEWSGR